MTHTAPGPALFRQLHRERAARCRHRPRVAACTSSCAAGTKIMRDWAWREARSRQWCGPAEAGLSRFSLTSVGLNSHACRGRPRNCHAGWGHAYRGRSALADQPTGDPVSSMNVGYFALTPAAAFASAIRIDLKVRRSRSARGRAPVAAILTSKPILSLNAAAGRPLMPASVTAWKSGRSGGLKRWRYLTPVLAYSASDADLCLSTSAN